MGEATTTAWAIDLLVGGYKHRDDIKTVWETILRAVAKHNLPIAVSGKAGVGKTVLFDHLTGKANSSAYQPGTEPSPRAERGAMLSKRNKLAFVVIPGQDSEPRHVAIEEAFDSDSPPIGVVHVVDFGFTETRNLSARDALIEGGINTVRKYRDHQLKTELEDLRDTCRLIRQCHQGKNRRPKWMLIAVAKADLFKDELEDARRYYRDDAKSDFVREVVELTNRVGQDNFRWDCAPVSAWQEDFRWNNDIVPTTLDMRQRNTLLHQFGHKLEDYCG